MSFQTTRWSLVFRASTAGEQGRLALAELCQAYWPPVHAFYRRACGDAEQALDLTQGLFARLLEREDFATAAPERGRFRSWLCACAQHHWSDVRSATAAQKRGGGREVIAIDPGAATATVFADLVDPHATPEAAFAQSWVRALLDRAFARLATEQEQRGRGRVFAMARNFLDAENGGDVAMRDVAAQLGMTEGAFKVAVHRLRERLRELVVDEVRQTVDDPGDAASEAGFLLGMLDRKES